MKQPLAIATTGKGDLAAAVEAFLKRVRRAEEPLALVRALGPHDLLLALREADAEQAGELLALADRGQVRGAIDLACWPADHPDLDALEQLLAPLVDTGIEGADKALDDLPGELRTLALMRYVVVHLQEDKNEEVPAADGSELIACPDGTYFIEIPAPNEVPDVIRGLLGALLRRPFEEYQPELECLIHDLPTELQEDGLRWRNARLADLGFGTREEGLALLAPRPAEEIRRTLDAARPPHPIDLEVPPPALYRANLSGRDLLDRSIAALEAAADPTLQLRAAALPAELTGATSLFLVAIGCDLGDLAAVGRGARWARDLINLGLQAVVDDDPEAGARALAYLVPGTLIQCALGLLAPLGNRARAVLADRRLARQGVRGALLDPPHRIAVDCLARPLPLNWAPLHEGRDLSPALAEPLPDELEAFADRVDVTRSERLLAEAEQLALLLFERLGWKIVPGDETASASILVLSALAQAAAGAPPRPAPIAPDEAIRFADRALGSSEERLCADGLAVLGPAAGIDPRGPLQPGDEPDPIRRLLLRLVLLGRARLGADDPRHVLPSR